MTRLSSIVVTGEQAIQLMRAAVERTMQVATAISDNDYLWNPLLQVVAGEFSLPGIAIIELTRGWLELGNSFLVDEFGFLGRAEFEQGMPSSPIYLLNHDKRFSWPDDPIGVMTFGETQEQWYLDFIYKIALTQTSKRIKMSDALILGVRTFNERIRL